MVCTRPIGKGQEVFNTYGQMANWQLLHMYGFAEPYPGNTNESADIQMETMYKAALQGKWVRWGAKGLRSHHCCRALEGPMGEWPGGEVGKAAVLPLQNKGTGTTMTLYVCGSPQINNFSSWSIPGPVNHSHEFG